MKDISPMRYTTYVLLRDFLDAQMDRVHRDYVMACEFIPYGKSGKAREEAALILRQKQGEIIKMGKELQAAAAASNKYHPNKKMREFWGLK